MITFLDILPGIMIMLILFYWFLVVCKYTFVCVCGLLDHYRAFCDPGVQIFYVNQETKEKQINEYINLLIENINTSISILKNVEGVRKAIDFKALHKFIEGVLDKRTEEIGEQIDTSLFSRFLVDLSHDVKVTCTVIARYVNMKMIEKKHNVRFTYRREDFGGAFEVRERTAHNIENTTRKLYQCSWHYRH